MDKKLIIIFGMMMVLFPFVLSSESDIGMFEQNKPISLFQSCDSCTYVNISSVKLPNGTIQIINQAMVKSGTSYTYLFSNTNLTGDYKYEICGDKDATLTCEMIGFEVTYSGKKLTTSQGIIFAVLLGVVIFLFLVSLYGISVLPSKDTKTDDGKIIDAGNLKHFRKGLFLISWILLTSIFYLSSNISFAYLSTGLFSNFLFTIYKIMYFLTLPIIVFIIIWIFVSIFQDKQMKRMIERGGDDFGDI